MDDKERKLRPFIPEACRALESEGAKSTWRTMTYVKCPYCVDGFVEVWGDENTGICLDCGAEWKRERSIIDATP